MSLEPLVKIESLKNALNNEDQSSLAKKVNVYKPEFDLVREGLIIRETIDVEDLSVLHYGTESRSLDLSFVFNRLYNHSGTGPILPDLTSSIRSILTNLHLAHADMSLAISTSESEYGDLGIYAYSRGEPKLWTISELAENLNSRIAESPLVLELYTFCAKKGTKRYELETYKTNLIKHLIDGKD